MISYAIEAVAWLVLVALIALEVKSAIEGSLWFVSLMATGAAAMVLIIGATRFNRK